MGFRTPLTGADFPDDHRGQNGSVPRGCPSSIFRTRHSPRPRNDGTHLSEVWGLFIAYKLSDLSDLSTVIQGCTLLPPVALPNLIPIDVEYDDFLDRLRGFREATLGKL